MREKEHSLGPCSFSRVRVYVHVCFRHFRTCGVRTVLRTNTDFVLVFVFNPLARAKVSNPRHFPHSGEGERTRRTNTSGGVRPVSTTEFEQFKVNCTKSASSILEHEHEHEKRGKKNTNARSCVHAVLMVLFRKNVQFSGDEHEHEHEHEKKNTPELRACSLKHLGCLDA